MLLPLLFREPLGFYREVNDRFAFIAFLDEQALAQAKRLNALLGIPFPSLFVFEDSPHAHGAEALASTMTVYNGLRDAPQPIKLKPDSSIVLSDVRQLVQLQDGAIYEHRIALGFAVTFGSRINQVTFYDYLDGLISSFIYHLRQKKHESF